MPKSFRRLDHVVVEVCINLWKLTKHWNSFLTHCIMYGGPKCEILNLLEAVKIMANLGFMGSIISRTNGLFDNVNMCMFDEICWPLVRCSIEINSRYHTLEELQFRNVPIINHILFSSMSTGIQNCFDRALLIRAATPTRPWRVDGYRHWGWTTVPFSEKCFFWMAWEYTMIHTVPYRPKTALHGRARLVHR